MLHHIQQLDAESSLSSFVPAAVVDGPHIHQVHVH